jgi:hypothetical protein
MPRKTQYKWREGSRAKVAADVAGAALERLRREDGTIKAERVVDIARPDESPLHPAMTWDDTEAAERFRLFEARVLIRNLVVVVAKDVQRPAYEHVPSARGSGQYEPGEVLVRRPDMYALALEEAMRGLTSAQERVANLRRYAGDDEDRMAVIVLAASALQNAETALRRLH